MKIVTYNINGIGARLQNLLKWLNQTSPDVVCLQELKAPQEKFPIDEIRNAGYQVLADWSADPAPLDPTQVDWRAVANGQQEVRVRQLPGAGNAMGKVKFEFPNPLGIYLHDTPEKQLMLKDARQFSNGCVRLEDAERLGRWLFAGSLPAVGSAPEQKVDLPELVPVYITYLTAQVEGGRIALGRDPYGRDARAGVLASSAGTTVASK